MLTDTEELFRKLRIKVDNFENGKASEFNLIEALRLHFSNLRYPDPTIQHFGQDVYATEFNQNYQAASILFDAIQSDDASIAFVISTIKENPLSHQTTTYLKVDFWTKMITRYYPVDVAVSGFSRIYEAFLKAEHQNIRLNLANRMIENFADHNETFEVVKNLINNFQSTIAPENGVIRTGFISRYLNLKYKQGNRDCEALIVKYWSNMFTKDANFEGMIRLCHGKIDLSDIGENLFSKLQAEPILTELTRQMFDYHMDNYSDSISAETLTFLSAANDENLWQRAYFWISELFKNDLSTFDFLIENSKSNPSLKKRKYALRLIFFHYHNSRDKAKSIVDVAKIDKQNFNELKEIMTSNFAPKIIPPFAKGSAVEIAGRGNFIIRAKIFDKICRKQKIDTGVTVQTNLKRSLIEGIMNLLASDIKKSTIHRLVYAAMNPAEKLFLNKVGEYQKFHKKYDGLLQEISPNDANAIKNWLESKWVDAISEFGFKGLAINSIQKACKYLAKDNNSAAAIEIREYLKLLRQIQNMSFDIVSNDLDLKREYGRNAELSVELEERTFFLVIDGNETDLKTAYKIAVSHYWQKN